MQFILKYPMRFIRTSIPSQLLCFILSLTILTVCSSCSSRNRIEGYIYYRLNNDPTTLDPALIVDVPGGLIAAKIFNGLVKLDAGLNISQDLAEKWTVHDAGRTYIFYLKKGAKFSNNREVIASDIKFSFMRVLDPKTKSPNTWVIDKISGAKEYMQGRAEEVSGIEIIDRYTVKLRLDEPFSPFMHLLTMTAAYIVPEEEVKKAGVDYSSHPVGTGPFVLNEWGHNDRLVLGRNINYFDGKAKVEGLVYRIITEDLTAVTEFELGNLDILTIPSSDYSKYRDSQRWNKMISSSKGLNTYYLGFNCSRPPFDDVNLRKAVGYAIDRAKILRTFYENRGRLAEGPVPDLIRKWDGPCRPEYDPAKARNIFEEAGAHRPIINFYVTADQEVVDTAELIQSYLKKAGLKVRIKQLEWSAYKEALNNAEADMFWISWWGDYPDPENFLFPLFHSSNHGASGNRTRYSNREADRLIEAGQREVNETVRNRYYMHAEKIITEEFPLVCFWHKTDFVLRQPAVKNYMIFPVYSMDKGTDISF